MSISRSYRSRRKRCGDDYRPAVPRFIDPYGPLQATVRLLRRPSGDVIVIGLAHAAADAFGLHTLMAQLLKEYESPGSVRPAKGGIPERDTLWTRELANGAGSATSGQRMTDPLWPDPFGTSDGPTTYHRETIAPQKLEAVRRRVKSMGGNINDAVMAAYFLTACEITGHKGEKTVFFPVNLRQHLRDGSRVMSNQSTNVSLTLCCREGERVDEVLQSVIAQTTAYKAGLIGVAEQAGMDTACDHEGRYIQEMVEEMAAQTRHGRADIFISNPGPVSLPEVPGLIDAYVCYPCGAMPTTCFVISTFRGTMTVTLGYQDGGRTRKGTKEAIELFCRHLREIGEVRDS